MSKRASKATERFLALLLAVVMLVGMIPTAAFAVEQENAITLTITSNDEVPVAVANANVLYTIKIGETESEQTTVSAGADGVAKIKLDEYVDQIGVEKVILKYTIEADGYDALNGELELTEMGKNYDLVLPVSENSDETDADTPEEPVVETVTLTVATIGNGTVKVNGTEVTGDTVQVNKDEPVKIEVIPGDNSICKYLKVGDAEVELEEMAYETSFSEDAAIEAKFLSDYTVSVVLTPAEGGVATTNGDTVVKAGEILEINVTANEGYKIGAITVGSNAVEITDMVAMTVTVSEEEDTVVTVTFVKTYKVTVKSGEDGKTVVDGEEVVGEGIVTISESEDGFLVKAVPNEGHHVLEVKIDGVAQTLQGVNDESFEATLDANKDYELEVTFAPNVYSVTADSNVENGQIVIDSESVEYNGETEVAITPATGYVIKSVTVNGVAQNVTNNEGFTLELTEIKEDKTIAAEFELKTYSVTVNTDGNGSAKASTTAPKHGESVTVTITPNENYNIGTVTVTTNGQTSERDTTYNETANAYCVTIENITDDVQVSVTFEEIPVSNDITDISFSTEGLLRQNGRVYVYAPNTTVTVSTSTMEAVALAGKGYNFVAGNYNTKSFSIPCNGIGANKSVIFNGFPYKIQVRTNWKNWETISTNPAIQLHFDTIVPTAAIEGETCFFTDATLTVSATDIPADASSSEIYTGITEIQYCIIMPGDTQENWQTLYTDNGNSAEVKDLKINVATEADTCVRDIVVKVKAKDEAGNWSAETSHKLTINKINPTISLDSVSGSRVSGAVETFAEGQSYTAVVATITVVDGTYNANGLEILDNYAKVVTDGVTIVPTVNEENSTVTFKVTITGDGEYGHAVYTSESGAQLLLDLNTTVVNYAFIVDNTAPDVAVSAEEGLWDQLLNVLTFGIYSKNEIQVWALAVDKSPITYEYYKSNSATALGKAELDELYAGGNFVEGTSITVSTEERFSVYFRVTDQAGNYTYVNSDGAIIDKTRVNVTMTPDAANENGIYGISGGDSVKVSVAVAEVRGQNDVFSGIKSVEYWIVKDGVEGEHVNLFTFDKENPTYEDLVFGYSNVITLNKAKYNSCDVEVVVKAVDNAGNETETSVKLDIDYTAPSIEVTYDKNGKGKREATIKITERTHHFDAALATAGVTVTAKDKEGNDISVDLSNLEWETTENVNNPDQTYHIAKVAFNKSANYTFVITYTDKAGNTTSWPENQKPDSFMVDTIAPTGKVSIGDSAWEQLLEKLTFGIFTDGEVTVNIEAKDETSNVSVSYYISNAETVLTANELDAVKFEKLYGTSVTVKNEQRFAVYFRVEDEAGNYIYLCSDGAVIDKTDLVVTLTKEQATNANGIYGTADGASVEVEWSVEEITENNAIYSGIKSIEYWITKDGVEGEHANLFTFDQADAVYADLVAKQEGVISVSTADYNSCDVVVYVKAVDNAGNETIRSMDLDIDITNPAIHVTYDNNNARNENYYNEVRVATVTITERSHHFNKKAATDSIVITAVDAQGNEVDIDVAGMISDWVTTLGATPDEDTHTATIIYSVDANYTFSITYTDEAGNVSNTVEHEFTVDTTDPTGTVKAVSGEGEEKLDEEWDELVDSKEFTFAYWTRYAIDVTGTSDDVTSPIESVVYYVYSGSAALSEAELDAVTEWTDFAGLELNPNGQYTVYLKITDMAGNDIYISTNGLIADNQAPEHETLAPDITITAPSDADIYNGDVKVNIVVKDPTVGNTYSGLKRVWYEVYNYDVSEDEPTQSGDLFNHESALEQDMESSITVDSKLNNSNNVKVFVYALDNAGNYSVESIDLMIDITNPVIRVDYDNDACDGPDGNTVYYNNDRIATIIVEERNFSADMVTIKATNGDGVDPEISSWTVTEGTGNGDNTQHIITIRYTADGDYEFEISCTDLATNPNDEVIYAEGTTNPNAFTVDKTLPTVNVSYDNNDAENGLYFDAVRTATVTIVEHNFIEGRVNFELTAARGGVIPNVAWHHNGDTHIATISYTADGDYTFDVSVRDLAGNANAGVHYGNSVAANSFTIDTTYEDMISYTDVVHGKAYGSDEEVIPNIKIEDINLDIHEVSLVGIQKDKVIDLTNEVKKVLEDEGQTVTGILDLFEMVQEMDAIYTLRMYGKDLAGNEDEEVVVFTVNRFGSVYVYSDYLLYLIEGDGAYEQTIVEDLIITEYNAVQLLEGSLKIEITCDGKPLENVIFTVTPEMNNTVQTGESGWYQYVYVISKDNFTSDGVYEITISSKDAAGNNPENSNYENMGILFRVDSTQAEITSIVGLEESIINATDVEVKYSVFDTMGIEAITIYVDGEPVHVITDFGADSSNYTGSFTLSEKSSAQHVRIVVQDKAGNLTDTEHEEFVSVYAFNKNVTVSTNIFVRWFANKTLFWGSIIGGCGGAGFLWFFLIGKKKKEEDEEAAAK